MTRTTSEDNDEALVKRLRNGDSAAFAALYDRNAAKIYSYAYHRLGSQADAEELTKQAFVSAYRRLLGEDFEPRIGFRPFLYRTTHALIAEFLQRRRREGAFATDLALTSSQDRTPEEELESDDTRQELQEAIAELADDQKQVIILKYVDGLTNPEVAEVLGKTERAVKTLQQRALASLGRVIGVRREASN
ncbi:MAG: RNA polymerase sigma factor [Anaerolineae bacterium]